MLYNKLKIEKNRLKTTITSLREEIKQKQIRLNLKRIGQ